MFKESRVMRELHEIREQMYEEAKGLSDKEVIEKMRREAEICIKKYGLKFKKRPSLIHS